MRGTQALLNDLKWWKGRKEPDSFPGIWDNEKFGIAVGRWVVVGEEARKLRSQEQGMENLDWFVKEFGLCPVGCTGGQQRFSRSGIPYADCFLQEYHCLSMEYDLEWGDAGGLEARKDASA